MWLRTVSKRDVPAVSKLLDEVWHATYDSIYGVERVEEITREWHSVGVLEKYLNRPHSEFILADNGKAILGIAYAAQRDKTVKLHHLYVLPSAQGSGIGHQLLQEIFSCFDDAENIELEVDPENTGAIAFYQKRGFQQNGSTENCGTDQSGIAALILSRPLE